MQPNPTTPPREETDTDRARQQRGQEQLAAAAGGGAHDPYRTYSDDVAARYAAAARQSR